MKIFAQVLLVLFFVILFFIGLLAATFKFQILSYDFWTTAFQKHAVYQDLAVSSKNAFENQITVEGGKKDDVKTITDLMTTENAKDVVDHNVQNLLSFVNGTVPQIIVYFPLDKIPTSLIPKNVTGLKSEMPIADLLGEFNFQDYQNLSLQDLSHLGEYTTYVFAGAVAIFLMILVFLILLVESGKRFVSPGIAFLFSGGLTLLSAGILTNLNSNLSGNLVSQTSLVRVVVGALFPPAITEIISTWKIIGLAAIIIGVILFFVKKPVYNNSHK
jgi:hypothetical protein